MRVFEDGDHLHGAVMTALAKLWPTGTAVLSGCEIAGSPSALDLTVSAGLVSVAGASVVTAGDTVTLSAATFDRYDLVTVNTSGTIVVVEGTSALVVPTIPNDSVPIAICLVEVGQSTLPADRVQDIRVLSSFLRAQVIDSQSFKAVASDNARFFGTSMSVSAAPGTWSKAIVYSMPGGLASGSTVRFVATVTSVNPGVKYQMYVNGSPVGTLHDSGSGGSVTGSDDITLQQTDTLELWIYPTYTSTSILDIAIKYSDAFEAWTETPA